MRSFHWPMAGQRQHPTYLTWVKNRIHNRPPDRTIWAGTLTALSGAPASRARYHRAGEEAQGEGTGQVGWIERMWNWLCSQSGARSDSLARGSTKGCPEIFALRRNLVYSLTEQKRTCFESA